MELNHNMKTFRLALLVLAMLAVAIAASQECCIWPGINFKGGNIKAAVKESKEECQKFCQDTSGCFYFTWVDERNVALKKKCFLKNMMTIDSKKKEGLYSGPKFCTGDSTNISKFEKRALDQHNIFRAKHQSDPLIIDKQLSAMAEGWAKQLAKGKKGHSKGIWNSGVGENLHTMGGNCTDDYGKIATKSWYSEIKGFDFEKMKGAGHFTQVVWKRTTRMGIGCACNKKSCFTVAQYFPAGNFDGIESYRNNVKKPLH